MAFIPRVRVCIQRWEAHLVDEHGVVQDPYRAPPPPDYMAGLYARSRPGLVPQAYIARDQAEQACRNTRVAGHALRLCSKREWQMACRGPDERRFPYGGDHRIEGRCNTHRFSGSEHLVLAFYPSAEWTNWELNDRRINEHEDGLARTGAYRECTSAYGAYDLVGNLLEWVSTRVPSGQRAGNALILGDHYMGQGANHEGCEATNSAHHYDPNRPHRNQRDYSTGFRCCADPR